MLTALCNTDIMSVIDQIGQKHRKAEVVCTTSDKKRKLAAGQKKAVETNRPTTFNKNMLCCSLANKWYKWW